VPVVFGDLDDPGAAVRAAPRAGALDRVHPARPEVHRTFLHALQRRGYRGRFVAAADHPEDERLLRQLGVDLVIRPLQLAARPLIDTIHAHDRRASSGQLTLG
jgi:hypothetical protein